MAVKMPGKITYSVVKDLVDDMVTVTEDEIANAIAFLQEKGKIVSEGAGACGMAAILAKKVNVKGKKVGIIISGGNIDPDKLTSVTECALEGQGRKGVFHIKFNNSKEAKKLMDVAKKCDAKIYFPCGCAACAKCMPIKKPLVLKAYFPNKACKTKFGKIYKFN
ncbi:MAG: pyridoxal-phosphate dependent enzyme [Mycoplasmoidaceae bacterium]|nr:pyridoxal-phosphate dependent enzyme [Mycoplasmoidaceae bacterium]